MEFVNKLMEKFIEDIGRMAKHMVLECILRMNKLTYMESGKMVKRYIGSKLQSSMILKMGIKISEIILNFL